jgi:hypothetical protein
MTACKTRFAFLLPGSAALASAALLFTGLSVTAPAPAEAAVVYCTGPGVPRGCVVRPTPARTVARVVYCTRPGYPVGCTARAGAVVRPGPGVNVNGGLNGPGVN